AAAAVDFLAALSRGGSSAKRPSRREALGRTFEALHRRGESLLDRMWNGLSAIDGITLYGPRPGTPRTPTVAFTVRGRSTDDVAVALAKQGVFVSNGDFYAATVIERLGQSPDGVVRAGCSCYTTEEEVERLVAGLKG